MKKVRIKKLPTAQSGLEVKMGTSGRGMIAGLGLNSNTMPWPVMAGQMAQPNIEVNKTLKPVERQDANLEAEKGETAFTDLVGDGIPQMYKIAGERHYNGGTPLNLPDDSFIFSRDNKMKISGPILESFGKHKDTKDKFTPAELSAKYDINEYRKILANPDSDKLQRSTAELMIANYNLKLAKLGLVQESKKGFPDGIPAISMPYVEVMQIDPTQFMMQNPQGQGPQGMPDQPAADNVAKYGKTLVKAQFGYATEEEYKKHLADPYSKEKAQNQMIWNVAHPTVNNNEQDYSKQLDDIKNLEKHNALWEAEKKQKAEYTAALNKAKDARKAIKDAKYEAGNIDRKIKENLDNQKKVLSGQKLGKGYFDINFLKQELSELTAQQKINLSIINQTAPKPSAKSTWTIEDYKKSLLDKTMPYDKKHQAQMDFLMANPQYVSQATASNVTPPPAVIPVQDKGVSASQTTGFNQPIPIQQTQAPAPVVTEEVEIEEVDEEFKLGGTYQTGDGSKTIVKWQVSKKTGNRRPVYSDGTFGPSEKGTAPVAKTVAKQTGTPENFDPYGVVSPELLAKYLTDEQQPYIRRESVKGYQPKTGKGVYGSKVTVEEFRKRNPKFAAEHPDFDPNKGTKQFQSVYNTHVEKVAYEDAIAKGYPEDKARDLAKAWVATQGFKEGNLVAGDPRYQDNKFGEFTSSRFEPSFKPYKAPAPGAPVETAAPADNISITAEEQSYPAYKTPGPEWWLQDKVKVAGAFGDLMRIKKYNPWMATPGLALPEGTFYDPTRELAANAEQVNLGVQGASTYSGPQSFAATAAALQGQGAANAANIMGRYNNLNVTESNRLGEATANVLNQGSQQRAANATQLFDKRTIVNQQFDNSKAMARQNLRQGFMDAITNRANTYNLNTLYPQFAVGPGNGGMIYNIPGSNRELNSNYKGQETPEEYLNRVHNMEGYDIDEKKWLRDQYPGASKSTASNQGYSDEELARIKAMRGYT
jgi:hypothetical protein